MPLCAVPFCNKNNPVHRFPEDPVMRKKWLEATKMEPSEVTIHSSICCRHFLDSDYTYNDDFREELLKETAVPSQHLEPNKRKKIKERKPYKRKKKCAKRTLRPLFGFNQCEVIVEKSDEVGIDLPENDEKKSKESVTIDIKPNLVPEPESDSDEQDEKKILLLPCPTFEEVKIKVESIDSEELDNCTQEIYDSKQVIKQEIDAEGCSSRNIVVTIEPLHVNIKSENYMNLPSSIGVDGLKIEYFEDDDPSKQFEFYECTGLDNYKQFVLLFSSLGPTVNNFLFKHQNKILSYKMKPEDQFLLTLIKLRLNMPNKILAKKFVVSEATAFKVFSTWINFLHSQYLKRKMWENLNLEHGTNCTENLVLKCVEVSIEKPKNNVIDALSKSLHSTNTLKVLLGLSCKGILTAVSFAYGGLLSDNDLYIKCGYRNLLEKNEKVFVSRDFDINKLRNHENVVTEIGNSHTHVETIFGLGKTYAILNETIPANLTPLTSRIIFTCFMLVNFKSHISG